MAKATKSHHEKRNHGAGEAWADRKKRSNINPAAIQFQKIYRINCLKQRAAAGRLTEKNRAEAVHLGVTLGSK